MAIPDDAILSQDGYYYWDTATQAWLPVDQAGDAAPAAGADGGPNQVDSHNVSAQVHHGQQHHGQQHHEQQHPSAEQGIDWNHYPHLHLILTTPQFESFCTQCGMDTVAEQIAPTDELRAEWEHVELVYDRIQVAVATHGHQPVTGAQLRYFLAEGGEHLPAVLTRWSQQLEPHSAQNSYVSATMGALIDEELARLPQ